ncbi:MAG TPA: Arm DNA-binding domain-containing protein [Chitinophagales bacterium]|nr:Arm DNA-binding domain-containing protein [Chitinophagales bacterium]
MNASIKVILYTSKLLKNGESPIMLRVIKDRKPKYISVGFSCHADLWDFENNIPKKKHPHYKEINLLIDSKKKEAGKLLLDLENENKNEFDVICFECKKKSIIWYLCADCNFLHKWNFLLKI